MSIIEDICNDMNKLSRLHRGLSSELIKSSENLDVDKILLFGLEYIKTLEKVSPNIRNAHIRLNGTVDPETYLLRIKNSLHNVGISSPNENYSGFEEISKSKYAVSSLEEQFLGVEKEIEERQRFFALKKDF